MNREKEEEEEGKTSKKKRKKNNNWYFSTAFLFCNFLRRRPRRLLPRLLLLLFFDVLFQYNFIITNYIFLVPSFHSPKSVRKYRFKYVLFSSMQQTQTQNFHNPRLSTSSHSSLSAATSALLNGVLPYPRFSQASVTAPTLPSNLSAIQLKELHKTNQQFQRIKRIKHLSIVTCLTILLAICLLLTIEFGSRLMKNPSINLHLIQTNQTNNLTNEQSLPPPLRAFFTCIWVYNGLLFLNCFLVHSIAIQRRSRRGRTTAVFLRYYFIYLIVHI